MSQRPNPAMIGGFVLAGALLLVLALLAVGGSGLFVRKERAVMHFTGSVYGLQEGAPVVFRGVQVGTVESIAVRWHAPSSSYVIPVVAELDSAVLRSLGDSGPGNAGALAALLQRGLRAQLAMQSLLTGLLYVDLDLRPAGSTRVPTVVGSTAPGAGNGWPEIPTQQAAIESLKNQLEGMDLRRLLDDMTHTVRAVRELAAAPELKATLRDAARAATHLRRLAAELDRRAGPLVHHTERTLERAGSAADGVRQAAARIDDASSKAAAVLAPDSALLLRTQATLDEAAHAAGALRRMADPESPLLRTTERTLADVGRAARALRELADTLEQQPESILKGKRDAH